MKILKFALTAALFLGLGAGVASAQPKDHCVCPPGQPCDCRDKAPLPPKHAAPLPPKGAGAKLPPRGAALPPKGAPLPPKGAGAPLPPKGAGAPLPAAGRVPPHAVPVSPARPLPGHMRPGKIDRDHARVPGGAARGDMRRGNKLVPASDRMNCAFCDDLKRTCKPSDPRCRDDFERCRRDCK